MLNKKIIEIRVKLQNATIKKSGKNSFAKFDYYELADFLPKLNELMQEYEINDIFTIEDNKATLKLIYKEQVQEYSIPFVLFETPLNKSGQKSMQDIQYLGALNTYYKRYLYLNAFGITDGEVIDSMNSKEIATPKKPTTKTNKQKLNEIIKEKGYNAVEIAEFYGLDKKSSDEDFAKAVKELESKEQNENNNN